MGISMEDINGGYMGNNHYVLPLTVEMVEKIKKMPNVLSVNHQEDDGQIFRIARITRGPVIISDRYRSRRKGKLLT